MYYNIATEKSMIDHSRSFIGHLDIDITAQDSIPPSPMVTELSAPHFKSNKKSRNQLLKGKDDTGDT